VNVEDVVLARDVTNRPFLDIAHLSPSLDMIESVY